MAAAPLCLCFLVIVVVVVPLRLLVIVVVVLLWRRLRVFSWLVPRINADLKTGERLLEQGNVREKLTILRKALTISSIRSTSLEGSLVKLELEWTQQEANWGLDWDNGGKPWN